MTMVPLHVLHSALALPRLNSSVYLRIQRSIAFLRLGPACEFFGRLHFQFQVPTDWVYNLRIASVHLIINELSEDSFLSAPCFSV
jgi:hypothetical protein